MEHGIGTVSGALSGSSAMPELERAPGATPSIMTQGVLGPNTELEDPPGLYEKVCTHPQLSRSFTLALMYKL